MHAHRVMRGSPRACKRLARGSGAAKCRKRACQALGTTTSNCMPAKMFHFPKSRMCAPVPSPAGLHAQRPLLAVTSNLLWPQLQP